MAQMQRGIQFCPFGVTSCAAARLAESTFLGRIDLGVRTSQKLVKIVNSPSHVMATSMTPVGSHICNGGNFSKAAGSKVLNPGLVYIDASSQSDWKRTHCWSRDLTNALATERQ
jgi:hypothetical protein